MPPSTAIAVTENAVAAGLTVEGEADGVLSSGAGRIVGVTVGVGTGMETGVGGAVVGNGVCAGVDGTGVDVGTAGVQEQAGGGKGEGLRQGAGGGVGAVQCSM